MSGWRWGLGAAAISVVAGAIVAPGPAAAQVNVEKLPRDRAEAGVSGSFDLGLSASQGNVDLLDVGVGGLVQHLTLFPGDGRAAPPPPFRSRILLVANRSFSSVSDSPVTDRGFVHLRWTRMRNARWGTDLFAQHQYDAFRKLRDRTLAGAGFRFDVLRRPSSQVWLGTAYMIEHERVDVSGGISQSSYQRWTNYAVLRHRGPGDRVVLQNTLYIQPRFDDFGDFRLLDGLEVEFTLGERLSLGLGLEVQRDSDPPEGVDKMDVRLRNTVRVRF